MTGVGGVGRVTGVEGWDGDWCWGWGVTCVGGRVGDWCGGWGW